MKEDTKVKKWTSWLLVLVMLFTLMPLPTAAAESGTLNLPAQLTEIEDEAFLGNTAITTVVIPKSVERIGARAFSGCSNLIEVYFGNSNTISIAPNAFDAGSSVVFNVFPRTKAELYALSHGIRYNLIEPDTGSPAYRRAMELVAQNGGFSTMQSGEWASQRLIVCRSDGMLPDISSYNPSAIIKDGDTFIIQFDDEGTDNTINCYTYLYGDANTVYVEADQYVDSGNDVSAAGVVDSYIWDTDDPMGFDVYAPFVAENANPGDSITIAVIDSGVKQLASYSGKLRSDGVNMLYDVDGESWTADYANHGSFIASIIADCVGSANVSILPIRVFGSNKNSGSDAASSFTAIGYGIEEAMKLGAKIINLSANFKESRFVTQKINKAIDNGVTVVVAAGNEHFNIGKIYPANLKQAVTVGGLGKDYQLSSSTNFGTGIDYTAPDSYVTTSAYPGLSRQGTSFSAPMISAALALQWLDREHHSIEDLNASCYVTPEAGDLWSSYGNGMPRLDLLAHISVEKVILDASLPDVLKTGEEMPLTWTVLPVNATDKSVTVTSSDESILAVENQEDGSFLLKALSDGVATVKVVSNDNSSASVIKSFTVVRPVSSITLSGGTDTLVLNRSVKLTATVEPSNATNRSVQWVSTNSGVLTVDQTGKVNAVAVGNASVYAVSADGYGATSNRVDIEVVDTPDASGLVLTIDGENVTDSSIVMSPGQTKLLTCAVLPQDAPQDVRYRVVGVGNRISVTSEGVITANSSGTGIIEVTSSDGNASAILEINVIVLPASVSITGASVINENEETALTATVLPENADNRTVSWSSTNPNVAAVTSGGTVKGISAGTATIIAAANGDPGITAQYTITVRHPFTLRFDLNGGGYNVDFNNTYSRTEYSTVPLSGLPTPQRDYYSFLGWYTTASEGGERISEGSAVTTTADTVTLYARWTANPYTVSFNGNGGTPGTASKTVYYDGTYGSLATATRTGYTFAGWYTAGGSKVESTTNVTTGSDHTLYAHWIANYYTYSIEYKSINGTDLGTSTDTYQYGTTNTIYPPEKSGYVTPAAQTVTWDSTSGKTITFTYTPIEPATSQALVNGTWWKSSASSSKITYAVTSEWRNRTSNSIEIQLKWVQTITGGYYGYTQKFSAQFLVGGSNVANTGTVQIASSTTWPSSKSPNKGSKTVYSGWITVPITPTGTSVTVQCNYWDANQNKTVSGSMSIPTF